jgi:hypothetical protein
MVVSKDSEEFLGFSLPIFLCISLATITLLLIYIGYSFEVAIVVIVAVVASWYLYMFGIIGPTLEERKEEEKQKKEEEMKKWYGVMYCTSCKYRWMSRRSTPPARCAGCGRGGVSPMMGVKH